MVDHREIARQNFYSGMNCAQSVFCAFGDVTGMDRDTALRLSSSFGGGLGGQRQLCGAVAAAAMVLGMAKGYSDLGSLELKKAHYARVRALCRHFEDARGSTVCLELLRAAGIDPQAEPSARTAEYYAKRPCPDLVAEAAGILDEMLREP